MNLAKWKDDLDCVCVSEAEMQACHLSDQLIQDSYLNGYTPERFLAVRMQAGADDAKGTVN